MLRVRLPDVRLSLLLVTVVVVSLALHHYASLPPTPPPKPAHYATNHAARVSALRSAPEDAPPRARPIPFKTNSVHDTGAHGKILHKAQPQGLDTFSNVGRSGMAAPTLHHLGTSQTPACALKSNLDICEEDHEYNEQIAATIRTALKNSMIGVLLQNSASSSLLQDSTLMNENGISESNITSRIVHNGVDLSPACRSKRIFMTPRRAHSMNMTWFYVVNQDGINQGIVYNKCTRMDRPCELSCNHSPLVVTTCKQEYIYRRMYVVNLSGTEIVEEVLSVPSSCVCHVGYSSGHHENGE